MRDEIPFVGRFESGLHHVFQQGLQLCQGCRPLSVGYVALILSGITGTFGLAFLAGCSIDSLLDLVIPRFETMASGKSKELMMDLGKPIKT